MQGKTVQRAIVDLLLRKGTDPATGYVTFSRFRNATSCLILQPFDVMTFQQGEPLEPSLLIEYIRTRIAGHDTRELMAKAFDTKVIKKKAATAKRLKRFRESEKNSEYKKPKYYWCCTECGDKVQKNNIRTHTCNKHSNKRVKGTLMKCRNDTTNDLEQIKMRNFNKHWICAKCSCKIHYNDIVDHQKLCIQDDTAS